jgi:ferric-dicitrate binding protein FerR (iron transport regulator)
MAHNKAYYILRQFVKDVFPSKYHEVIKGWLVDKKEGGEKESAVRQIWDETHAVADESTEKSLYIAHQKIKAEEKKTRRIQLSKKWLSYAAILALPVISGISVWTLTKNESPKIEMITCYVPNGEQRFIDLPDGSSVQVNAGSIFIYPKKFTQEEREVHLVGEANFSIAKNKEKPFIVHIKSLQVEVTGTKFNVESYPENDRITTTLEQGSVIVHEMEKTQQPVRMSPNEQLIYYEKEARFEKKQVHATSYCAWTHGELYFSDKSMYDIINTLERHFDIQIQIDPQIITTDLYTMRIRSHETLENTLYILTQIAGNNVKFRKKQGRVYLFPQGKGVNP